MVDWDGTVIATTPRLILRTFRRDDLPALRWLGGHSDSIAEWAQELYAAEGIGLLAVERQEDGAFLGMCGLHHHSSHQDDVEIGWRLAYEHWGRGYATEAATGWLDLAFGPLGLERVISITDAPNERSLAVMRRLGMTFDHEGQVEDEGIVFDAVVYAITAERWRAR